MGTTTVVIQHRGRARMHQQQLARRNAIGSPGPSVPTRGLHVAGAGSRGLTGRSRDAPRGVSVRWRSRRGDGVRA